MRCACADGGINGITYCERHAIEHKRRLKIVAGELAMAGEDLRKELHHRAGIDAATVEAQWLRALRRAKEALDG